MKGFSKKVISVLVISVFGWSLVTAGGKKTGVEPLVSRFVPAKKYKRSPTDLVVIFVDVGQGNCIYVEAPSGAKLIYDGGGNPEWMKSNWDPGIEVLVPFLEARQVNKIDYMVMSHAHGDHIGGLAAVINNFKVDEFLDPGYAYTTRMYEELLNTIKRKNIKYRIVRVGKENLINLGDGITCEIFSPPADFYFQGTNSDCNNSSMLIKLTYGRVSFLFTGDMETRAESYVSKKYKDKLTSNILQVCHHGSFTSSTIPFLQKVLPEVAVIPVGKNNMFKHPRPEALNNLENIGAKIYRTDYDGNVTVFTNGKTFTVETEK